MLSNIGTRLKTIRKKKGITLQDLATKTNLSIGLLSNVERNLRSPTIVNFHKICNALDITINDVLAPTEEKFCVKKEEREEFFSKDDKDANITYTALTVGERSINGMCMIVMDNAPHKSFKHIGDELGIIVSGSLQFELEGDVYDLHEGDTIYVPMGSDHSFKKTSKENCISYWVSTHDRIEEANS